MSDAPVPAPAPIEIIEDAFVDPFIETVIGTDGKKFARVIKLHRDRVQDYIEGKTACIMTDDGVPLAPARQNAIMERMQLERMQLVAEILQRTQQRLEKK